MHNFRQVLTEKSECRAMVGWQRRDCRFENGQARLAVEPHRVDELRGGVLNSLESREKLKSIFHPPAPHPVVGVKSRDGLGQAANPLFRQTAQRMVVVESVWRAEVERRKKLM